MFDALAMRSTFGIALTAFGLSTIAQAGVDGGCPPDTDCYDVTTVFVGEDGYGGGGSSSAYSCTKAGLINLTRELARGLAPDVRVNAIAPGLIKTDFAKTLWTNPKRLERVENLIPLRRIGDPHEIAGTAVFLASDAAAFLTGQVLNVDGGNAVV